MSNINEDDLWDMSDDELASAFKEAQASITSTDTDIENEDTADLDTPVEESDDVVEEDETEEFQEDEDEQPEEVSDDDTAKDPIDEDDASSDEETLDEGSDEDDAPSSEEGLDVEEKAQLPQAHKFKANGKDFEFTSQELIEQFPKVFGQAMDYTKKMQTIKPWRKTIDALDAAKLSHEDVGLMIDVFKGDKSAISEVIKRTGVDTLDLDTDENDPYVAKNYGRDDQTLAIQDVVDSISSDPEYVTTNAILSKDWDDSSWGVVSQNPEMIRLLHQDVKSGMYQQLQPLAEKVKVFSAGAKSDLDCYKEAAQQFFKQKAARAVDEQQREVDKAQKATEQLEAGKVREAKAKAEQRTATKKASAKRKAAAPTTSTRAGNEVVDYLDDSDEAFDEWYKNLQDNN